MFTPPSVTPPDYITPPSKKGITPVTTPPLSRGEEETHPLTQVHNIFPHLGFDQYLVHRQGVADEYQYKIRFIVELEKRLEETQFDSYKKEDLQKLYDYLKQEFPAGAIDGALAPLKEQMALANYPDLKAFPTYTEAQDIEDVATWVSPAEDFSSPALPSQFHKDPLLHSKISDYADLVWQKQHPSEFTETDKRATAITMKIKLSEITDEKVREYHAACREGLQLHILEQLHYSFPQLGFDLHLEALRETGTEEEKAEAKSEFKAKLQEQLQHIEFDICQTADLENLYAYVTTEFNDISFKGLHEIILTRPDNSFRQELRYAQDHHVGVTSPDGITELVPEKEARKGPHKSTTESGTSHFESLEHFPEDIPSKPLTDIKVEPVAHQHHRSSSQGKITPKAF